MKKRIESPFRTFSHPALHAVNPLPPPLVHVNVGAREENIIEGPKGALKGLRNTKPVIDKAASLIFENQLLSYKEAARYLGISEPYLRRLKSNGHVAYVPIGRRGVRFKLSSLKSWVDEREVK